MYFDIELLLSKLPKQDQQKTGRPTEAEETGEKRVAAGFLGGKLLQPVNTQPTVLPYQNPSLLWGNMMLTCQVEDVEEMPTILHKKIHQKPLGIPIAQSQNEVGKGLCTVLGGSSQLVSG